MTARAAIFSLCCLQSIVIISTLDTLERKRIQPWKLAQSFFFFFWVQPCMKRLYRIVVPFPSSVISPEQSACLSKKGYLPTSIYMYFFFSVPVHSHWWTIFNDGRIKNRSEVSSRKPFASYASFRTRQQFSTQLKLKWFVSVCDCHHNHRPDSISSQPSLR